MPTPSARREPLHGACPELGATVWCETEADLVVALQGFLADAGHPRLAGAAFSAPSPCVNGLIQLTHARQMRLDRDHLRAP